MRGNRSSMTGLFIWAGQLISVILILIVGEPNIAFWPVHVILFLAGLTAILVFNWQYWKESLRYWRKARRRHRIIDRGIVTYKDLIDDDEARQSRR